MGAKQFLQSQGVKNRTPLVKVIQDILNDDCYDSDVAAYVSGKQVDIEGVRNVQDLDKFFFVVPLLDTLFNYNVDFSTPAFKDLRYRLDYAVSRNLISKEFLDKYLKEWGLLQCYYGVQGVKSRVFTKVFLNLLN